MKDSMIYYSVGALLYCPANKETIANSVAGQRFGKKYSLALCLEDTINSDYVSEAEQQLIASLHQLYASSKQISFYLPKIFIRIRCPEQIEKLYKALGDAVQLLTGFIIPKFAPENADSYIERIRLLNEKAAKPVYMMPILESPCIIHLQHRSDVLYTLKAKLDAVEPYVLNIRVGGNDLCHMFGFRRQSTESIHDIKPISAIFSDIITVFGMQYVISGPVWEYYNGDHWDAGLIAELDQDRQAGFIGKTVIHPKQIDLVNTAYQVSKTDLEDAKSILNWDEKSPALVSGSARSERMNEYNTHYRWAQKILFLSEYYGVT